MEIVFVLQVEAIDYETSLKAALERDGAEETFRVSCTAIVIYENYIQHALIYCTAAHQEMDDLQPHKKDDAPTVS